MMYSYGYFIAAGVSYTLISSFTLMPMFRCGFLVDNPYIVLGFFMAGVSVVGVIAILMSKLPIDNEDGVDG